MTILNVKKAITKKILTTTLPTIICSIFIIITYWNIKHDMGNCNTQLLIAFSYSVVLYLILSLSFKEKKFQPFLLTILFSIMFLNTEIGKMIRIQQENHVISEDVSKFKILFYDGKEIIGVNSTKISSISFSESNKTVFILYDGTTVKCIKNKCDIFDKSDKKPINE